MCVDVLSTAMMHILIEFGKKRQLSSTFNYDFLTIVEWRSPWEHTCDGSKGRIPSQACGTKTNPLCSPSIGSRNQNQDYFF